MKMYKRILGYAAGVLLAAALLLAFRPMKEVQAQGEAVPMYRMFNTVTGEHLYTGDANERNTLMTREWRYEGKAWYTPSVSNIPVYRLFHSGFGIHLYTADANEYQVLQTRGWTGEGIAWYADEAQTVPVYREFYPYSKYGDHNYTTDRNEDVTLAANGWNAEGIAFYVSQTGNGDTSDAPAVSSSQTAQTAGTQTQEEVDQAYQYSVASMTRMGAAAAAMQARADSCSSPTDYLILVDCTANRVGVFQRNYLGHWINQFYVPCTDGKSSTPTIRGTYSVGLKERYFDSGRYRCWYATQIRGDYLFHSVLYAKGSKPTKILDGTLGASASHGCVRLQLEYAKWIYDNVPSGSTIVLYDE